MKVIRALKMIGVLRIICIETDEIYHNDYSDNYQVEFVVHITDF